MKVAFITSSFFPHFGGAEIMVHNLILGLKKEKKIDATLYVPHTHFQSLKKSQLLSKIPYEVKALKPLLFQFDGYIGILWNLFFLKAEQKKYQYDLWHCNSAYPTANLLSWIKDRPKVLVCHGEDIQISEEFDYGLRRRKLFDKRIRKSLKEVDRVVAISQTMENELKGLLGSDHENTTAIPNFVLIKRFDAFKAKKKNELRQKLGLPENKKIILTVGRHHPKKGFSVIPELIEGLKNKRDDFIWCLIGKGASKIQADSQFFMPVEGLTFDPQNEEDLGQFPTEKLLEYYFLADICVFPSLFESFGVTILEAQASGLPVIAYDSPGVRDVISSGKDGLLVKRGDSYALKKGIERLMKDPNICNILKVNGLKKIEERFDLPLVTDSYYRLYTSLLKE